MSVDSSTVRQRLLEVRRQARSPKQRLLFIPIKRNIILVLGIIVLFIPVMHKTRIMLYSVKKHIFILGFQTTFVRYSFGELNRGQYHNQRVKIPKSRCFGGALYLDDLAV
ncbi:hypothetical protein NPIL_97881 [Nephila pilipes]|uniref:Transmembrane protein n=1 Tax=Nephila pilipes TaxID=299642 RepID=A0A8X6QYC2_NEPPI|nr:hypothetical protein NPIL_97881 [Nephila pilipes]